MYDAIMKAADQIETNPETFSFSATRIPGKDCGTPGCALGWIGHFSGGNRKLSFLSVPPQLGLDGYDGDGDFYYRMKVLCRGGDSSAWKFSASKCAETLRLYAEKYHAPEKPQVKTGVHPFVQKLLDVEVTV